MVGFKQKLETSDSELRSIVAKKLKKCELEIDVKVEPPLDLDYDVDFTAADEDDDDDPDAPKFSCRNCKTRFETQELADEHRKVNKCFTRLTCNVCLTKFRSKKGLRRHYKAAIHDARLNGFKMRPPVCESKPKDDMVREEIPVPDDLVCTVCTKTCSSKTGYRRHARIHSVKEFSCKTCLREFSRMDQLMAHSKIHDNDSPKFECDYCGKSYYLKSILREHIRIHTRENCALCSFCGKSFTSKSNMKQHILRHTNTKQFECKDCGKKFVSKGELKGHIRIHTGSLRFFACTTMPI